MRKKKTKTAKAPATARKGAKTGGAKAHTPSTRVRAKVVLDAQSSDKDLARAVAQDDERAWGILYNRWSVALTRFGLNHGWDNELVGDLVQDTLIRAWDNRLSYNPQYPYRVWILTIFRRLTASAYRRKKIHGKTIENGDQGDSHSWWAEGVSDMNNDMRADEIREALKPVLATLKPEDQRLLALWSENLCQADLARAAGMKPVTLRTRVLRARAKLGKAFADMYPETAKMGWDGLGAARGLLKEPDLEDDR